MVQRLLPGVAIAGPDAADALAVAHHPRPPLGERARIAALTQG